MSGYFINAHFFVKECVLGKNQLIKYVKELSQFIIYSGDGVHPWRSFFLINANNNLNLAPGLKNLAKGN